MRPEQSAPLEPVQYQDNKVYSRDAATNHGSFCFFRSVLEILLNFELVQRFQLVSQISSFFLFGHSG